MTINNPCGIEADRIAPLVGRADQVASVGELLSWARREPALFSSRGVLSDVVVQDEFTHDVVVALTSGLVLAYEST